jgi:uncharacterized protein YrrD
MNNLLLRATELVGLPVVTIDAGEAIADTKDVIYSSDRGRVLGFTLNKRGRLRGPAKEMLPIDQVHAVGRDAVMVANAGALASPSDAPAQEAQDAAGRNVLGNSVLTDDGKQLGKVTDLIVEMNAGEVVGYQLAGDESLQGRAGQPLLLPLPATLAVSGDVLMVPGSVEVFIRDDLSGFGSAVDDFRAQLKGASE